MGLFLLAYTLLIKKKKAFKMKDELSAVELCSLSLIYFMFVFLGGDWESTLDGSERQSAILHVSMCSLEGS